MATASAIAQPEESAHAASWSFPQYVSWYTVAVVLLAVRGPVFVAAFAPPGDFIGDFGQDWASARNYATGIPVYDGTREAFRRHIGSATRTDDLLPRNAHPPGSILVVLPFAPLSYPNAHLAWNLVTFPLFALAVVLVLRALGARNGWPAILPALGFGAVCDPLLMQIMVGNFSCLLAFLLAMAWHADRRGFVTLAGALIGVAAGVKLFPAFLLLYFVATKRWKGLAGFAVGFTLVNGTALALFGVDAYLAYFTQIAPAVAADNVASWLNASLAGFWTRITGPTGNHGITPLVEVPLLGKVLVLASQFAVGLIVGWVAWRSRTPEARDRAFALATVGMLLVCPLAWPHTFLLLLVPVALLALHLPGGPRRWLFVGCLVVVWLPANYLPQLVIGPQQAMLMLTDRHEPLSAAQNLAAVSATTYVLLLLFALTWGLRAKPTRCDG